MRLTARDGLVEERRVVRDDHASDIGQRIDVIDTPLHVQHVKVVRRLVHKHD